MTYSVSADLRARALLADSSKSFTVAISSSNVSGVKEASPSTGQTQAETLGTRMEMPSSRYSNAVGRHSFATRCSPQIGADCDFIFLFAHEWIQCPLGLNLLRLIAIVCGRN